MPIGFTIEQDDLPDLILAFNSLSDHTSELVQDLADQMESDYLDEALRRCPALDSEYYFAPTSTGNLKASHDISVEVSGDIAQIVLENDADYAKFVHDGHGTVEARPWMEEAATQILTRLEDYGQVVLDWLENVFEGAF